VGFAEREGQDGMSTPLFNPPPAWVLPVSLGQDIIVTFQNVVPGSDPVAYQNFPPTVLSVSLVIGKLNNTLATGIAVISGSNATCRIPFATADSLKNDTPWRCVVVVQDSDGINTDHLTPINGVVHRYDGPVT
jgi:hypothetical protein